MLKQEIEAFLSREPFVPLRLYLVSEKTFDIPFRDVARLLSYALLVFIGLKEGTRQAKGYDRFSFDQIARIEELKSKGGRRQKKAS